MSAARGTIFVEDAAIVAHDAYDGDQYIIRLAAPKAAAAARPGSFAHVRCDPDIPMRRPLSIMRADRAGGWIELLYKPVGPGLRQLATHGAGETVSILAPIGNGFAPDPSRPRILALGGGVGIPPVLFLAESVATDERFEPVVLMGSEVPFPLALAAADSARARLPRVAIAADACGIDALEKAGIPSLTASNANLAGARAGYITDLAREILQSFGQDELGRTQIAACGPGPMLKATAALAAEFSLPCQLALEEYMACGVGGCAGCAVAVHTAEGVAMKRVCVDGPVFEAAQIYPGAR